MVQFLSIYFFPWISSIFVGFFKSSRFFGVTLYNGYRVFPGGKDRSGRDADPSPPSSAVVMKG